MINKLLYPAFVLSDHLSYTSVDDIPEQQKMPGMTIGRPYYKNLIEYDVYDVIGDIPEMY